MKFKTLAILTTSLLFLAGVTQAQDSYQGFHVGQSLGEPLATVKVDLDGAKATCASPPKGLSIEQKVALNNLCPKINPILGGEPTELEFPKHQIRLTFSQGHLVRVTDFNGVIHLQESQAPTSGPTAQTVAQAQAPAETKQPVPKTAATPGNAPVRPTVKAKVVPINDEFAKASIRALKAIQGDATLPDVTQGGNILFSKQVVDAIDAADSEARTAAETWMSTVLGALHVQHSTNNMEMALKEEIAKAGYHYKYTGDLAREMETREMLEKDPGIAALKNSLTFQNEAACAAGLESLFRARKSGPIPDACTASDAK